MTQKPVLRVGEGVTGGLCKNQEPRTLHIAMSLQHTSRLSFRWSFLIKVWFMQVHAFLLAWCTGIASQSPTRYRTRGPPSAVEVAPELDQGQGQPSYQLAHAYEL